ncbi:MAG: hypothetical protein JWQ07_2452 [Ramlibacter sp.]|nr:hypothetical protein [Ramlibacter sp.]
MLAPGHNWPMLTLFGQTASLPEILAFVTGLASVWLTRSMHVANWPVGIVSVLCFVVVFLDAKLYADALLQLAFVALGFYGWWRWSRPTAGAHEVSVSNAPLAEIGASLAVCALATWGCAMVLRHGTDSPAPWADAAVSALSLLATWAQARGRVECWFAWIVVDLIAIPLYWSRSLALTAALYVLFLLLCVAGLAAWQRRLPARGQPA